MPENNGHHARGRTNKILTENNGHNTTTLQPPPVSNGTEQSAPVETDPCLVTYADDLKPDNRVNVAEKYAREISERTGLSLTGVYVALGVVILTFILFVVVIALAAAWPKVPHKYQFPVCQDGACLKAASQLSENMDRSVSPCKDLWRFMCGGWLRNNPLPTDKYSWNQKQELVRKEIEKVRDIIATLPLPLHTNTVKWKLKYFYEGCMDVLNTNSDNARPLTDIISELGGWYILGDFNEYDFDKNVILQQLHVNYGVSAYFRISVEPNPRTPGTNSIRISPGGLGLPDKALYFDDTYSKIQTAYAEFIRDIIIYLSTARSPATKFGKDIFSYEKRIAEITPDRTSLLNPITSYNAVTISELKEMNNMIPFEDILQAMYPGSSISDNTEVIITSLDYLNQISQIIATTDRLTLNGYLIWTLVRKYIPYLSETYTSAFDTFNTELLGNQKSPPRWETCSQLVRSYMGLAVDHLVEPINETDKAVVKNMFESVLNVAKSRLSKFDSSGLLHNHLRSKLHSMRLQIGLPLNTTDESFVKKYYLKLKVMKNNVFATIVNGVHFKHALEESFLNNLLPENTMLKYLLQDIPRVFYSPSDNAVIIPRALLQAPYFDYRYPSAILYGRLGVEVAHAITSAVLPYDSLWTADKKILSPFHMTVNESLKSVKSGSECLKSYMLGDLNLNIVTATANETSLSTLKKLSSIDLAQEAFVASLDDDTHIHQPGLEEYEDTQLFFMTYAQTKCSNSTTQFQLYKNIVDFELPEQKFLLLSWIQLQQFSASFDCPSGKKTRCRDIF